MTGFKATDVLGSMFVVCWGENHVILWDNWVSETQYMLGIRGVKLKFEFHVNDTLPKARPEEIDSNGVLAVAKHWMKGMWCGRRTKRNDSGVVVEDEDQEDNVCEFELMDDYARVHAVVPVAMI